MSKTIYVLSVNQDTWKSDRWKMVGVFDIEGEAIEQGKKFSSGVYSGYRVVEVALNPEYEEWAVEEEEEGSGQWGNLEWVGASGRKWKIDLVQDDED